MHESTKATIELCREKWAEIARRNDWYSEPFYVQVWVRPDGTVYQSVSTRAMAGDVVVELAAVCYYCADDMEITDGSADEWELPADAVTYCGQCDSVIESETAYLWDVN